MNRREFIKNSLLFTGGAVLLSGCSFKTVTPEVVNGVSTTKFKDLEVSKLGFGCMRLPTLENGSIDQSLNKKMVERALNAGINYFDTAYMYMGGKSEEAMGQALKKYDRNSFNLTTKMPVMMLEKEDDVERIFNEQLKRCKTEYFDFYLVHCLNKMNWENTKKYNVIPFLEKMKAEGKIRYLGFSHHDTPELLQEIIDDSSANPQVKNVAIIKLAAMQVETIPYNELEKMLEPVLQNGSWSGMAKSLLALSALHQKDYAKAQQLYGEISTDANTPDSLKEEAQDMIAILDETVQ